MIDKLTADGNLSKVNVDKMLSTFCWLGNPNATNTFNLINAAGNGYFLSLIHI